MTTTTAKEKLNRAEAELAGYRAGLAELQEDGKRLAREVALGTASAEDWTDIHRREVDQKALIGALTFEVEELRQDAKLEDERRQRDLAAAADKAVAELRAKIWKMPKNAARIFLEALEASPEVQIRRKANNGRARLAHWSDDMAEYLVPKGLVQRTYTATEQPKWIVVDEFRFREWVHTNAMHLISPDLIADQIKRAKHDRDVALSQPQRILIQPVGARTSL